MMKGLGLPTQLWVEEPKGVFALVAEHFGGTLPGWAAGPSLSLVCVMLFSIWQSLGFEVVVLLAALTTVPKEIYEAAAVDGATGWRRLRHITIPLISPTLFFLSIISTIRAFRVFSQVYVLGSKDATHSADTVTVYIFRTFYDGGRVGYGSATAMILFLIILAVTLLQMRVLGARVHY
jgi:multiple sugar transport system permease protein